MNDSISTPKFNSKLEVPPENLIFNAGDYGFYYLGSPYTDPSEVVMNSRCHEAWRHSGLLSKYGVPHYCAIWAKHEIAKVFNLPKDARFWWAENLPFMHAAIGMIVAVMPGYEKSKGLSQEIEYIRDRNKPIYLSVPEYDGLKIYKMG